MHKTTTFFYRTPHVNQLTLSPFAVLNFVELWRGIAQVKTIFMKSAKFHLSKDFSLPLVLQHFGSTWFEIEIESMQ